MRAALCAFFALAGVAVASTAPEQIHVAFAGHDEKGNCNGMAISWATANATATSTVIYGDSPSNLTETATGFSVSYLPPYQHHHVVLSGLHTGTKYYYKAGDSAGGYSDVLSFTTGANAEVTAFNVAVFGDFGYGTLGNAVETHDQLNRTAGQWDWILHVGDIGYANDWYLHDPSTFGYETVYNNYMNWMQPYAASKAYMVLPGNHEGECHSPICMNSPLYREKLSNFSAYNARFRMPAEESGATGANMWYSFNYGLVHFVQFDTETDFPNAPLATKCPDLPCGNFGPGGQLLAWLEQDLAAAAADRAKRPWIIVSGHRPIYTPDFVNPDGSPSGEAKNLQDAIEGLMHKYGVDIYFCGHKHSYLRTYPVYNNVVSTSYDNPKATVHFITGGAGCDEMKGKLDVDAEVDEGKDPAWTAAKNTGDYGMGILQVKSASELEWTWYESHNGGVLDSVKITKS